MMLAQQLHSSIATNPKRNCWCVSSGGSVQTRAYNLTEYVTFWSRFLQTVNISVSNIFICMKSNAPQGIFKQSLLNMLIFPWIFLCSFKIKAAWQSKTHSLWHHRLTFELSTFSNFFYRHTLLTPTILFGTYANYTLKHGNFFCSITPCVSHTAIGLNNSFSLTPTECSHSKCFLEACHVSYFKHFRNVKIHKHDHQFSVTHSLRILKDLTYSFHTAAVWVWVWFCLLLN